MTPPFHVVLVEPEIPPNTGNIARLCAGTGIPLHLVGPLGFRLDDKSLRRAGLDYWHHVTWQHHSHLSGLRSGARSVARLVAVETSAPQPHWDHTFEPGDALVFGSETRGLRPADLALCPAAVRIPMCPGTVRSFNLATSVAIVLFEALRQAHRWPDQFSNCTLASEP